RYGVRSDQTDCCGKASGVLNFANGKPVKDALIWVEDTRTGAVLGTATSSADGNFALGGLPGGTYKMFAERLGSARRSLVARDLGEIKVSAGESEPVEKTFISGVSEVELRYLGFNGQLSEVPVLLNVGRTYVIYLGGSNLDPEKLRIGFSSPHITLVPGTVKSHDYGDDLSVISFEAAIDPATPIGDYSVFVHTKTNQRAYLAGALTVDAFLNPYSTSTLFGR
ncbi:MAG: carboxypeptidase-like regulatory domain-containing protein, partial [Acidobacteria bacterium]|nr:carboxypeptidase-like regulatory domain-containing protein [Acidobacteriota bacterium]